MNLDAILQTGENWPGSCEPLCDVDAAPLTEWITRTLLDEKTATASHPSLVDCLSRHCMPSNLEWNDMGKMTKPTIDFIMEGHFPNCRYVQPMLSCLMAGQTIHLHRDNQPLDWIVRVHVPITTNDQAIYWTVGEEHNMQVGKAYLINTKEPHQCWNEGDTHRIHFMFDVLGPYGYGVK